MLTDFTSALKAVETELGRLWHISQWFSVNIYKAVFSIERVMEAGSGKILSSVSQLLSSGWQIYRIIQISVSCFRYVEILLSPGKCLCGGYELFSVMSAIIYHGSTRFLQKIKPEHFPDERSYYLRILYSKTSHS